VFEREAVLDEFVDHGEVIDARVSKELLVSLFVPARDNVLHDGALIVKDWRVAKAACVLPLSHSSMAVDFGTRHRAGVGITEETDAVALVISEERGEVSLCFRGNIARDLEGRTLRSALRGLFDHDEESAQVAEEAQAAADLSKAVAALSGGEPVEKADASGSMRIPQAEMPVPRSEAVRKASEAARRPAEEGSS
jgi:hypothetical protein